MFSQTLNFYIFQQLIESGHYYIKHSSLFAFCKKFSKFLFNYFIPLKIYHCLYCWVLNCYTPNIVQQQLCIQTEKTYMPLRFDIYSYYSGGFLYYLNIKLVSMVEGLTPWFWTDFVMDLHCSSPASSIPSICNSLTIENHIEFLFYLTTTARYYILSNTSTVSVTF